MTNHLTVSDRFKLIRSESDIISLFPEFVNKKIQVDIDQFFYKIASGQYNNEEIKFNSKGNLIDIALAIKNNLLVMDPSQKERLLDNPKAFIDYLHDILQRMPIAKKKITNNTKLQRRMDSLSRMLSVPAKLTACIAVAFIEEKLYITANTPADPVQFQSMVTSKLALLRDFIRSFGKDPVINRKMALDFSFRLSYDSDKKTLITGIFNR